MKLLELKNQYMYHTSPLKYAYSIIHHDELLTSKQAGGGSGVSISRDDKHIRYGLKNKNYAIFILDLNKLKQKFKIVPYSENESSKDGQFEEHIKADVLNLHKYLIDIKYKINTEISDIDQAFIDDLDEYKKKFNI